ncbi:MAG: hypothetical protein US42_C0008G0063 [Candidatus Magasanikbacteria bacterium GW2011_GWC2_37_14]|uniref:Uncharacterized protein n=1 Tax=Candidatus Magasanikbacteria bacterium GW2011_GWC2_37_14 TaxID=1619046 RepID=A0A0G0GC43_9BACT|nr:MAG: hypothetical protein US42_C0008G0063 [Candidatus Magasanikbacteria bacterium GW2011_GWC2_37_14]
MKKAFLFLSLMFVLLFGFFCTFKPVLAQGPYLGLEYGADTGLSTKDIRFTTARIINTVLGLLGMVSVVIIIYAGFKWMTAGGNEENATSARKILFSAVIGLVIILSAYSIARYVNTSLYKATTGYDYESMIIE